MDFVLDTNILVHFVRSDAHIRQLDEQFSLFAPGNAAFISLVSVGEIRSLAFQFNWGKKNPAHESLSARAQSLPGRE